MFNNSGRKIKNVTKILFWILFIGSIVFGLAQCIKDGEKGIVTLIFIPPLVWLASLLLYSWGQHVEDVEMLKKIVKAEYDDKKCKESLDQLRAQDLLKKEKVKK